MRVYYLYSATCLFFYLCLFQPAYTQHEAAIEEQLKIRYKDLKEAKNDEIRAKTYVRIANNYISYGNLDSVYKYANLAQNFAAKKGLKAIEASAKSSLAYYHHLIGDDEKALSILHAIVEDTTTRTTASLSSFHQRISNIYHHRGDYALAIRYAKRAFSDEMNPYQRILTTYSIGYAYMYLDKVDSAQFYLNKAYRLAIGEDNKMMIAQTNRTFGTLYKRNGDLDKAERYYKQSLAQYDAIGNQPELIFNLYYLIEVLLEKGEKIARILPYVQRSKALALELGSINTVMQYYEIQAKIDSLQGNYQQALVNYKRYTTLKDSVFNINKDRNLQLAEKRFQTREKEQRIASLEQEATIQQLKSERNQLALIFSFLGIAVFAALSYVYYKKNSAKKRFNEAISEKNQQLEITLAQKGTLMREIHHRTKNNLYLVESLLKKQMRQIDDEKARKAFKESQSHIEAISIIHKQLYTTGGESLKVALKELLQALIHYFSDIIHDSGQKITLQENLEEVTVDVNEAVPIALIVNELLTNAIQHAFPTQTDEGSICINLTQQASQLLLDIYDNGIGLDTQESSGLKLVDGLLRQVGGSLHTTVDNGTRFQLTIPLSAEIVPLT